MITLTTDFGDSGYTGAMRGAILSVNPEAQLVDLTHGVPPHDVQTGAFALFSAVPYYPEGSVHVAVVDPGVGTERRGIAIQAGERFLVGPDNGLLMPVARRLGNIEMAVELSETKYFREQISRTFHGRDIFGPVAGHLDLGVQISDLGPELSLTDLEDLDFGEPFIKEGIWRCEIINVDHFGNATTNLPGQTVIDEVDAGATAVVEVFGERIEAEIHETYGKGPGAQPFLTIGSSGMAELAMREASFADHHEVDVGDEVTIQFLPRAELPEERAADEE